MPYFAVALARKATGWTGQEVDLDEVEDLDLEIEAAGAATVVEWGHGLVEQLADARLEITLERAADGDERTATLAGFGGDWAARLSAL